MHSFGHDIESSWLIDWGASLLPDFPQIDTIRRINSELAACVYERGYNGQSLANEAVDGKVDASRVWWVQAEAVLGFLNEWEKSSDARYGQAAGAVWNYISRYLLDARQEGEWFWQTDETGNPDMENPIVEPWKCPYHNGRMCFRVMEKDPDLYL